jgi:hypothetical protein
VGSGRRGIRNYRSCGKGKCDRSGRSGHDRKSAGDRGRFARAGNGHRNAASDGSFARRSLNGGGRGGSLSWCGRNLNSRCLSDSSENWSGWSGNMRG